MLNLITNFLNTSELSPTMRIVFIAGFTILSMMFFCLSIEVRNKKSDLSYGQFTGLFIITVVIATICAAIAFQLVFFGYLMQ